MTLKLALACLVLLCAAAAASRPQHAHARCDQPAPRCRRLRAAAARIPRSGCPEIDAILRTRPLPPSEDKRFLGPFKRPPPWRPPDCMWREVQTGAEFARVLAQPRPRIKFIRIAKPAPGELFELTPAGMPFANRSITFVDGNDVTVQRHRGLVSYNAVAGRPFTNIAERSTCIGYRHAINSTQPALLPCSLMWLFDELLRKPCSSEHQKPGYEAYGDPYWQPGPVPGGITLSEAGEVLHSANITGCCLQGPCKPFSDQQSPSRGTIVGIAVGVVLVFMLALLVLLATCCTRRQRQRWRLRGTDQQANCATTQTTKANTSARSCSPLVVMSDVSGSKGKLSGARTSSDAAHPASRQLSGSSRNLSLARQVATITAHMQDRYAGTAVFVSSAAPLLVEPQATSSLQQAAAAAPLPVGATALTSESAAPSVARAAAASSGGVRHALLTALLRAVDVCMDRELPFAGRYLFVGEPPVQGGQALVVFARSVRGAFQQFAVKFFLHTGHFDVEADLYANDAIAATMPPVLQACSNAERQIVGPGGITWPAFIVTERGATLSQWLLQPRPSLAVLLMMRDVADKLHQLHAAGYTHRDLKPDNILWLFYSQTWCLLDLGIAATTGELAEPSCTKRYAAPEVIAARISNTRLAVSSAQDIFALALLVYEALTGAPALPPNTANAAEACAQGEAAYTWERQPPEALEGISCARHLLLQCLSRDAAARPSAAAVRDEIDSMARQEHPRPGQQAGGAADAQAPTPMRSAAGSHSGRDGAAPQHATT